MYFSATFLKIRTTHETSQYCAKQDTLKYIVNIGKCVLIKVKVHSLQNFHCDSLGTTSLKTVMSKHFRWGSSLIEDWVSMKSVIVARCKWKLIAVACTSHSVISCYWRWFFFVVNLFYSVWPSVVFPVIVQPDVYTRHDLSLIIMSQPFLVF